MIRKLKESYSVVSQRNTKATQDYVIYRIYLFYYTKISRLWNGLQL